MSLYDTAIADGDWLFDNDDRSFVVQGTFTAPAPGNEVFSVLGNFNDISTRIDLATGVEFTSQEVGFVIRRTVAQAAVTALQIPTLPAKGWTFTVTINNEVRNFVISEALPDRALGYLVYMLMER